MNTKNDIKEIRSRHIPINMFIMVSRERFVRYPALLAIF